MDVSKITNVLIFKDGYYWLTMEVSYGKGESYKIIPEEYAERNGFEFASDAYAYIAHLQWKNKEPEATFVRKIL